MTDRSDIIEVLARYVRAADNRDPRAMADLYLPDATVEIFYSNRGVLTKLGELSGAENIGDAVRSLMAPHPERGWSHHTTSDHIVTINGDDATIDAQFIVFNTVGQERPAGGWPDGASGAQGSITPIESGYYRPILRRVDGAWRIARQVIVHDLPMAFPGA
ncbi:nuclear transport factor 2 family protein [Rhizobium sp. KAs_5_22]|uniref:nuclear transport factor 2 family protein n=1 Tax=Ciceribacter selenitireducens TaxID=448181 RepID=UPI00048E9E44|nr:nuclear transport factor 2 family protein [Ciceribacter selenitireducens]PPJ48992.1 nuclear transport factor 2 family protein [Rhizobium sp. KAs_5_22]